MYLNKFCNCRQSNHFTDTEQKPRKVYFREKMKTLVKQNANSKTLKGE